MSTWHRHGGNFQRTVIMENANQWEEYFPSVSMHNCYKTETAVLFLKTCSHSETDNASSLIVYM